MRIVPYLLLVVVPTLCAACESLPSPPLPELPQGTGGSGGEPGDPLLDPGGVSGAGGVGGTGSGTEPRRVTKDLTVWCTSSVTLESGQALPWELTITTTPIQSGEEFTAEFTGIARFNRELLYIAQSVIQGGVRRVDMKEFQVTIVPYANATGPEVVLTHEPIPIACGEQDPPGNLTLCDPDNDLVFGAPPYPNTDCEPLDPSNPCGIFIELPISEDCTEGGECWNQNVEGDPDLCSGVGWCDTQVETQCLNGFCVDGELEVPLSTATATYVAAEGGEVAFGWRFNNPSVLTSRFADPPGPIGLRFFVEALGVAIDCSATADDPFFTPPRPQQLPSFPIRQCDSDGSAYCPEGFERADGGLCLRVIDMPAFVVEDQSAASSCTEPVISDLESTLPLFDAAVLSSDSLVIRASVTATNVNPGSCGATSEIGATASFLDVNGRDVSDGAFIFGDADEVTLTRRGANIDTTAVFPLAGATWSETPDDCCRRSFQTVFEVQVDECEGWGPSR